MFHNRTTLLIYIILVSIAMVNCSTNPVLDELLNLKKQVRRQSAFHPGASVTKAHIQIGRDEPAGPLVTSLRKPFYYVGVKPIIHYPTDPSKGITLRFGPGPTINVEAKEDGNQQVDYFIVRHNGQEVYHCFYNEEPVGELLNVIIDADRVSFAETPFSTCKNIMTTASLPKRYPIVGDSPIVAASRRPWYEVVDTAVTTAIPAANADGKDESGEEEDSDENDEDEGLFMKTIHRSR